jgi:hypothetical protein
MSAALPLTLALCLVANAAVALFVLRHRGLGRLAARLVTARPAQSLLVATGLAVATCALTAGLVAADSVDRTSLGMVERSWGAVDLTVAAGHRLFPADVAERLAGDPEVAAVTDGVAAGLDVTAALTRSGARSAVPDASLTGLDPGRQSPFGDFVLDSGRTVPLASLGPDQALVSRLLANRLGLHAGDRLDVRAAGPQGRVGTLRVAGVVSATGPAGGPWARSPSCGSTPRSGWAAGRGRRTSSACPCPARATRPSPPLTGPSLCSGRLWPGSAPGSRWRFGP